MPKIIEPTTSQLLDLIGELKDQVIGLKERLCAIEDSSSRNAPAPERWEPCTFEEEIYYGQRA